MGALANDGWLDGEDILSPALIAEAARQRIRGQDLVLPFEMSWGAGFMRNETVHPWGPGDADLRPLRLGRLLRLRRPRARSWAAPM